MESFGDDKTIVIARMLECRPKSMLAKYTSDNILDELIGNFNFPSEEQSKELHVLAEI